MDSHQERVFQSFRRVQGWFEANKSYRLIAPQEVAMALATQLDALAGVVQRLTEHVAQQETQAAQSLLISKDEREQRIEVLSHHMGTIAKTARALRGVVPGIGVLQMPKGNIQSAALITAASVMARKAEVYRSVLVENGLPTDFPEQLEAAAMRLKASLDARGLARGARTAAGRGIETELGLGRRVVAILDATLARVLRREPVKWAEWRHVQRVTQRGHVPKEVATGTEIQRTVLSVTPTGPSASPTEVVGSPTVQEKAA
jgi:hypothetical protein